MIFTSALEGGSHSGSGASEPGRPRGSGGVWGLEARVVFGGGVGSEVIWGPGHQSPSLSFLRGMVLSLRFGGGVVPSGIRSCGERQWWPKEGSRGSSSLGVSPRARRWPFCLPSFPPKPRLSFSFKNYITPEAQFLCLKKSSNLL